MAPLFLLLDLFLFLIPIGLLIDRKNFTLADLRQLIAPSLVSGILFSAMAVLFTYFGIWNFDQAQLVGIAYNGLPLEQYLFAFAFTFAGLGIYSYLNTKFPNNHLQKFSLTVSNLVLGVCVAFLFFAYAKWYTVVTFSVLLILVLYIEYLNKLRFMYRFYRMYVLCLLLFYLCYGLLCNQQVITYHAAETVRLTVFRIPLENHFFIMAMLLLAVYVHAFFKNRVKK